MQFAIRNALALTAAMTSLMLSGCVSDSARAVRDEQAYQPTVNAECTADVDIRYGRPNQLLDGTGWVFGIPRKLLLWDRRVDNHAINSETIEWIEQYATSREVDGLCVRVNQYDAIDEFHRLRTNDAIAPGWRYTVGTMTVIGYTLVPGRIFGGDQYNPFTNSVYIHSDVPALAVEATAYAQDVQSRNWPGTYAAVNELPVISVWHETVNTKEAVAFVEQHSTKEQQHDSLRIIHSNYGSTVAVAVGAGPVVQVGAAIAGQVTGAFHASRLPATKFAESVEETESEDQPRVRLASAETTTD